MKMYKVLFHSAIAALVGFQGLATYNSGGSRFIFKDFSNVVADGFESNGESKLEKHVHAVGDPAKFQGLESGVTAIGKILDFRWAQLSPTVLELRKGFIDGKATLIFDSEASYKALLEDAEASKKPKPEIPKETRITQLDSTQLIYTGTVDKGTIEVPSAWTFHDSTKGVIEKVIKETKSNVSFDQSLDFDGTKGQVVVVQGPTGKLNQLESGIVEGPVHFTLLRHEQTDGTGKISTTQYKGVADRLIIDLTKELGTVTATGHVNVDGSADDLTSHFIVDKFVILVNRQLEPKGVQLGVGTTKLSSKDGTR